MWTVPIIIAVIIASAWTIAWVRHPAGILQACFLVGFVCFLFEFCVWVAQGYGDDPHPNSTFAMLSVLVMACSSGFIELKAALKNQAHQEQK